MRKSAWSMFQLFAGIIVVCASSFVDSLAQSYPIKSIRLVVGFPPGGGADTAARLVAQKLSDNLGQPVIIENRAGASGSIATETVAKSPADGYALLLLAVVDTVQPALRAKLPYDLERDLAPISLLGATRYLLVVHPSVPARNVKELIALARSQPGKLSYASSEMGTPAHLTAELFKSMAKVQITQVPYKGSGQYTVAIASGEVPISFVSLPAVLPLLASGKIRALAIGSAKRSPLMPSIPTIDESGLPGYDMSGSWFGLAAPAGVPKDIIARLNAVIGKVVNTPEMQESFNKRGIEPQTNTPEQFAAFVHSEIALNTKLIRSIGIKAE